MVTYSAALLNEFKSASLLELVEAIDRELAYENLFISDERFYRNPYAQLALAARHTDSVGIGTGVTNPYTRNPALTASGIATIDEISNGRAILGLGAGSPMALDSLGIEQQRPIGVVRDAVRAIRTLLDGESVDMDCQEFELHDLSLDFEPDRRVPVYVAGRGPQILSLGGHIGDGVIAGAGLTSVDGMQYAMDRIEIGAEQGGRSVENIDVICWAFLSIAENRNVALDAVTPLVGRIVQAVPIDALEAIGISRKAAEQVKAVSDIESTSASDLRDVISKEVVEQFSIVGTPSEARTHVERLQSIGIDHIAVLPFKNAENNVRDNLDVFSNKVIEVINNE